MAQLKKSVLAQPKSNDAATENFYNKYSVSNDVSVKKKFTTNT